MPMQRRLRTVHPAATAKNLSAQAVQNMLDACEQQRTFLLAAFRASLASPHLAVLQALAAAWHAQRRGGGWTGALRGSRALQTLPPAVACGHDAATMLQEVQVRRAANIVVSSRRGRCTRRVAVSDMACNRSASAVLYNLSPCAVAACRPATLQWNSHVRRCSARFLMHLITCHAHLHRRY